MIKVHSSPSPSNETEYFWNLSTRKRMGSRGMEVKLIQYLLVVRSMARDDGEFLLSEVDGIWGSKTERYMEKMVQDERNKTRFVDDHYMSPMPPGTLNFQEGKKFYKIAGLQFLYITFEAGRPSSQLSTSDQNDIILGMPDDLRCPSELASALRVAKAAANLG